MNLCANFDVAPSKNYWNVVYMRMGQTDGQPQNNMSLWCEGIKRDWNLTHILCQVSYTAWHIWHNEKLFAHMKMSDNLWPCVHACVLCMDMSAHVLPKEWAAVVLELKKRPKPRSPSFTSPVAVMNTLAGLMSGSQERDREGDTQSNQGIIHTPFTSTRQYL